MADLRYLKYRIPGVALLAGGIALGGESAASAFHFLHPALGGWFNPLDGLGWLSKMNGQCIIEPRLIEFRNGIEHIRTALPPCHIHPATVAAINARSVPWFASGAIAWGGFLLAEQASRVKGVRGRVFPRTQKDLGYIRIGRSTGKLRALGHAAGIRGGQDICLSGNDLYQHVLGLGGIGSGKSSSFMNPAVRQIMEQGWGAFIVAVKEDLVAQCSWIAAKAGVVIRHIGVGGQPTNLMDGLPPERASAYFSSVMLLGDSSRDSKFWNTTATNYARAALGILYYFPAHYSLPDLYRYTFVPAFREDIDAQVDALEVQRAVELSAATDPQLIAAIETDIRTIANCKQEIANHDDLTPEIKRSVTTQLSSALSGMIAPEIEDAFFATGAPALDLESTYKKGAIFTIHAGNNGLSSTGVLAFAKQRFFDVMTARRALTGEDRERPVAFVGDEYASIATCPDDGRGDQDFFATCRDTKTSCILACQSISGLIAKVGDDMAKAVLASMRTRLIFRTEDQDTIKTTLDLLGQVEVERESESSTRNPGQWGKSRGTSTQTVFQPVAHAELFRNLEPFEAVVIASIGNRSCDDVVKCAPEFLSA
jgi:hypothetical protein